MNHIVLAVGTTLCVLGVSMPNTNAQTILRVDDNAALGGDGMTWATAFAYLQDALAAASLGDEIRIATGTYRPDQNELVPGGTGQRNVTFQLRSGVSVRGAYAGLSNPQNPDDRDVELYETVFSGDLAKNDGPNFTNYSDNSYHVISVGASVDAAILEGITIRSGNASGGATAPFYNGGGLYKAGGNLEIRRCRFTRNYAERGGGLYNEDGGLTLSDTIFEANKGLLGGGMVNFRARISLGHCTFRNNSGVWGAGLMSDDSPRTILHHSEFSGNVATGYALGGGVRAFSTDLVAINCLFANNAAVGDESVSRGGGLYNIANRLAHSTLINCVFNGNVTNGSGGGAYFSVPASSTLKNCTFHNNSAQWGGGLRKSGRKCNDADTKLVNCILWNNAPDQIGDGDATDPAIEASFCDIEGGWVGTGNLNVDPRFVDAANGDLRLAAGSPCIDSGDTGSAPTDVADLDGDGDPHEPLMIDFEGHPRRIDIVGVPDSGDGPSPIVDRGAFEYSLDCNGNTISDVTDIVGKTNLDCNRNGVPDECEADCNSNGVPDACDVSKGTTQDCNDNGVPDICEPSPDCNGNGTCDDQDIAVGSSQDCNEDGIPDECGEDCNHNRIHDVCDILAGASEDCNDDGVPDECLSADVDCNHNGLIDACETWNGVSPDHNSNNLPDECEPTRLYVNANSVGRSNGTSWANAMKDLQRALAVARNSQGRVKEIWVAAATYWPGRPGDLSATYLLVNGVALYGGFQGSEASVGQRNVTAHETVLSCDLTGDDMGEVVGPSRQNNCFHVVTGSGTDATAILDGFTIRDGYATGASNIKIDSFGGGMLNRFGNPTVSNCTFSRNSARGSGAGMYNWGSSPTLTNCVFSGNVVQGNGGAGITNYEGSNPSLIGCKFIGNTSTCSYQSRGGAMFTYANCSPTLRGCLFDSNEGWLGGALYNDYGSSLRAIICEFANNYAEHSGGAIHGYQSELMFESSIFRQNSAKFVGGAAALFGSSGAFANCLFFGNSSMEEEGGAAFVAGNGVDLTNCTLSENVAAMDGGGFYNSGAFARLTNCILWNDEPNELGESSGAQTIVSYSDVMGGWSGAGNLSSDPMFADPENRNYRLSDRSPCIDAGDKTVVTTPNDLDGFSRTQDDFRTADGGHGTPPIVDLGAYEFRPGDCSQDGDVDVHDIAEFIQCFGGSLFGCNCFDLDGDSKVNLRDFAYAQIFFTGG